MPSSAKHYTSCKPAGQIVELVLKPCHGIALAQIKPIWPAGNVPS